MENFFVFLVDYIAVMIKYMHSKHKFIILVAMWVWFSRSYLLTYALDVPRYHVCVHYDVS